nr:large tegument protein [Macronycteris gammaherpesvirus 1]
MDDLNKFNRTPKTIIKNSPSVIVEGLASNHQGECKYGKYAGMQCLSNCVTFLLYSYYNKSVPITETANLDHILNVGAKVDFILRENGHIDKTKFVQLKEIPGVITTPEVSCYVYQSPEIYGFLGQDSDIVFDDIKSLKNILSSEYGDVTQYFVFICNSISLAVLIKSSTFHLFNPHCLPQASNSVGHVIRSNNVDEIISYVGEPKNEYTGVFLYFVPIENEIQSHRSFIGNNYNALRFQDLNPVQVNLLDVSPACKSIEMKPETQKYPHVKSSDFHTQGGVSGPLTKVSNDPTLGIQEKGVCVQLDPCMDSTSSQNFSPPPPILNRGAQEIVASLTCLKRKREDITSESDSEDERLRPLKASDWRDDLNEDIWIDDTVEPIADLQSNLNSPLFASDEDLHSNIEVSNLEDFQMEDQNQIDQLPPIVPDVDFSYIDSFISNIKEFSHKENFPQVRDSQLQRDFREANALRVIDKIVTNIILENGIVAQSDQLSKAKNLLRFVIIWGKKLNIPTQDLEDLMETNLEVSKVYTFISENIFSKGEFLNHVTTKINKCLPKIYTQTQTNIKKMTSILNSELKKIPIKEQSIDLHDFKGLLTSVFGDSAYQIFTKEEETAMTNLTQELKNAVIARNVELTEEENVFDTLLSCLKTFSPFSSTIKILETQIAKKNKIFQDSATHTVHSLSSRVRDTAIDFTNSITQDHMDTTYLPDIHNLISNIDATIKLLSFVIDDSQMEKKPLLPLVQQLKYMGGELASMTNSDWFYSQTEPVTQIKELTTLKTKLSTLQKDDENLQAIEQILDDIENMLRDITSQDPTSNVMSKTLSIPMLENYIKNAGTLIGQNHNSRYMLLKNQLQELASSEEFLINLIHSVTLYSVSTTLAKIEDVFSKNPHLKTTEGVIKAFNETSDIILNDAMDAISSRDLIRLDISLISSLQMFLKHGSIEGNINIGNVVFNLAEAIKSKEKDTEKQKWIFISEKLSRSREILANANISGSRKKKIFSIIQTLESDCQKQSEKELMEEWKKYITETPIDNMESAMEIISQAPNVEAKELAEKILKDRIKTLQENEEKQKKESEQLLIDAIKAKGNASWQKIQAAFDNLAFEGLGVEDWAATVVEFNRQDSPLTTSLPPKLSKLTDSVESKLNTLLMDKVMSLFPNGPTFTPLEFDWLDSYRNHANFHLKTFPIPKIQRQSEKVEKILGFVKQALEATELIEATIGTPLEAPSKSLLDIFNSMKTDTNLFKSKSQNDVDAYIHNLKHSTLEDTLQLKPQIQLPKSIIPNTLQPAIFNLPETFQKNISQNESLFTNELKVHIDKLHKDIAEAENNHKLSQSDINSKISEVIKSQIPKASINISSKPFNHNDPLSFLENIVRDKQIINSDPYQTTLDSLEWLENTHKAVLPLCPSSLKKRIGLFRDEMIKEKSKVNDYLKLESEANATDDIQVLVEAINNLDQKRVTGGKPKFDEWVKKKENLEKILQALEKTSEVEAKLNPLIEQSKTNLLPSTLTFLLEETQSLLNYAKKSNVDESHPHIFNLILELQMYLTFKRDFLKGYESSQEKIFHSFPLTGTLSSNSDQFNEINLVNRLAVFKSLSKQQFTPQWIETRPHIDTIKTTLIPNKSGPPIHMQVVFINFLEAILFNPGSISSQQLDNLSLPGTHNKRLGIEILTTFNSQWPDIVSNAPTVILTYTQSKIQSSVSNNSFFAMVLFAHMVHIASKDIENTKVQGAITISQKQWIEAILALWPELAAASLNQPSLQEAVSVLRQILPTLKTSIPLLFLNQRFKNAPNQKQPHQFPEPRCFLFNPSLWQKTDIKTSLWDNGIFSVLYETNSTKSRVGFLLWGLLTLDPVVVSQLWNTLKPLQDNINSPIELLYALAAAEYPNNVPTVITDYTQKVVQPYSYGVPTGKTLIVSTPISTQKDPLKITAFEIAIGSILCNVSLDMYITSKTPWITDPSPIFLVAPLLDCTGLTEPFKSLKVAPKSNMALSSQLLGHLSYAEEFEIFLRQHKWIQQSKEQSKISHYIVIVDTNNFLDNAYTYNPNTKDQDFNVIFIESDTFKWPKHAFVSSTPTKTVAQSKIVPYYHQVTTQFQNIKFSDVFSTFPLEIHDQDLSKNNPNLNDIKSNTLDEPIKTVSLQPPTHKNIPSKDSYQTPHISQDALSRHSENNYKPPLFESPLIEKNKSHNPTVPVNGDYCKPTNTHEQNFKSQVCSPEDSIGSSQRSPSPPKKNPDNPKSPHSSTLPNIPSISTNFLTLEKILNGDFNPGGVVAIEKNLDTVPVKSIDSYNLDFNLSKNLLLEIIHSLRAKVLKSTNTILHTINRLKIFYL